MMTNRQKEIICASLELIAEKGIQGLTIKNLANSIGISEPAIYRHYENKIQILIAIRDHFRHNMEQIHSQRSSDLWHHGYGGGIWVSPFKIAIISALVEFSRKRKAVYFLVAPDLCFDQEN